MVIKKIDETGKIYYKICYTYNEYLKELDTLKNEESLS